VGLIHLEFGYNSEFNQTLTNLHKSLKKLVLYGYYENLIILPNGCVLEKN